MMMKYSRLRLAVVAIAAGLLGGGIGIAVASQPQMDGALRALHSAQDSLGMVTMDKGGHANKARRLVSEAIAQVEQGIAYGNAHGY